MKRVRGWQRLAVLVGLLLLGGGVAVAWAHGQVANLPERVRNQLRQKGSRNVPLARISPKLSQAIIAIEDRSFYDNIGISFTGIARAIWIDLRERSFTEGGSTITQQLARDQLLNPAKTISRKLQEILLALMMTRAYSKDHILELYLNEVYFGHGAWGVRAASLAYFRKAPATLSWPQASLLAGLPQSPGNLDPYVNWVGAKARQAQVLQALVQTGTLSPGQARVILAQPIRLGGTAWRGTGRSSTG